MSTDYPAEVIADIANVLQWIDAHPSKLRSEMGELEKVYIKWRDVILSEKLLDNTGTMWTVPGLSSFGRLWLLEHAAQNRKPDVAPPEKLPQGNSSTEPLKAGTKNQKKRAVAAFNYEEWGIGFDPDTGWHVFRLKRNGKWVYTKRTVNVSEGALNQYLRLILEAKGVLLKRDVMRYENGGQAKGRTRYPKDQLSRLRKRLREAVEAPDGADPFHPRNSAGMGDYDLRIIIGSATRASDRADLDTPPYKFEPCNL